MARRTATAFGAESKVGGTIDFLSWQGYDSPKSLGPWLKANGVKLKPTYIATHDDIQAKILALHGGKGYDIITYYQGYKQLYDQLKILTPLDEKKIPNIKGMLPFFKSNYRGFWVKNGVRTAVPMYWGALGLVYDSKAMPTAPNSYDILFTKKLKGAVTVDDDPVGVLHAGRPRAEDQRGDHDAGAVRQDLGVSREARQAVQGRRAELRRLRQAHRRRRRGDRLAGLGCAGRIRGGLGQQEREVRAAQGRRLRLLRLVGDPDLE